MDNLLPALLLLRLLSFSYVDKWLIEKYYLISKTKSTPLYTGKSRLVWKRQLAAQQIRVM